MDVLLQVGKDLHGKRCKNRWCAVCNRIRTAQLIDGYEPSLRQLEDSYFVTLTKQSVKASSLAKSIDFMAVAWRQIVNGREGRRRKIKGIRKAECTIRPGGLYHYHFHVIIEGFSNAEWLVSEWLKSMGSLADRKAQDIRVADEKSLKELFKYFTKLTVKDKGVLIDFKRMDVIFNALRTKRVYQPFGGVRKVSEEIEENSLDTAHFLDNYEQRWLWDVNDWINEFGECLTGHIACDEDKALFEPIKIVPETEPALLRSNRGGIGPTRDADAKQNPVC